MRGTLKHVSCVSTIGALCALFVVLTFKQKTYGHIGSSFIHVHHLVPVSEIGKSYQVNPVNDLRPVCPICHAMLHTSNPPLGVEQLKRLIKARQLG